MDEDCDVIELTVPAAERHARMVRLVAAAAARHCGFGIDRIDDVKLIVGEGFLLGAAVSRNGRPIRISIRPEGDRLHVRMFGLELGPLGDEGGAEGSRLHRYGLFVMGSVADKVWFLQNESDAALADLEMVISHSGAPDD